MMRVDSSPGAVATTSSTGFPRRGNSPGAGDNVLDCKPVLRQIIRTRRNGNRSGRKRSAKTGCRQILPEQTIDKRALTGTGPSEDAQNNVPLLCWGLQMKARPPTRRLATGQWRRAASRRCGVRDVSSSPIRESGSSRRWGRADMGQRLPEESARTRKTTIAQRTEPGRPRPDSGGTPPEQSPLIRSRGSGR